MKKFDESKHPRDKEGKFTDKNTSSLSVVATKEKESTQYSEKVRKYKNNLVLQQDVKEFKEQIDLMQQNKIPSWNAIRVRSKTPQVLIDIGLDDLPMLITQRHLKNNLESENDDHAIDEEVLLQIPFALENPEYILKSKTKVNSVVVVTSLLNKNGDPIVISIDKDGKGIYNNIEIKSNFITSIYGRKNFDKFINSSEILYKK